VKIDWQKFSAKNEPEKDVEAAKEYLEQKIQERIEEVLFAPDAVSLVPKGRDEIGPMTMENLSSDTKETFSEELLLSCAEGKEVLVTPEGIMYPGFAREILLERWAQPKPKHPDIQKAIDAYPSRYPNQSTPTAEEVLSTRAEQYGHGPMSEWSKCTYQEPIEEPPVGRMKAYYPDGKRPKQWPSRWSK